MKLNNLELALGMALKFYTIVATGLKLKVRKFFGLIPTFLKVTGEKLKEILFLILEKQNKKDFGLYVISGLEW